jgi:hypothetical protein
MRLSGGKRAGTEVMKRAEAGEQDQQTADGDEAFRQ